MKSLVGDYSHIKFIGTAFTHLEQKYANTTVAQTQELVGGKSMDLGIDKARAIELAKAVADVAVTDIDEGLTEETSVAIKALVRRSVSTRSIGTGPRRSP